MNKGFITLNAEVADYFFSPLSYLNFNKLVILVINKQIMYTHVNVQNVAVSNLN